LLGLLAPLCAGQGNSPITLDTNNETLFAVLTAVNACGFDDGLAISDPVRLEVRAEVEKNLKSSDDAQATANAMCDFYQSTRGNGAAHDLSQYVSLALYLQGPPNFLPKVKEDEMPPDAGPIAGFGALLEKFYEKAGLHAIWDRHKNNYAMVARRYHEPLAKMVFDTEIYLKMQSGGYLGRNFTVYLDFMGDPSETNARNYGSDYDVVVFPSPDSAAGSPTDSPLKMNEIRHTFLHYLMDPLAEKHPIAIKRLEPLLQSVKRAPLEEGFRTDISLLVTECLVRAVEIRTTGPKQTADAMRAQAVDDAVRQGYILTKYFYNALVGFEKDPAGIRSAYPDILDAVDVRKEEKAAAEVDFAKSASPELLQLSRLQDRQMLVNAEKRLAAGDTRGARELAQQAMDKKIGDQGRALFILAEVAVANKDMPTALDNFHKAIAEAKEARVIAWSHVYLGRILDLKDDRPAAVIEYQAALTTGGQLPEIKAAAERGLARAYEPPAAKPQ
jgi:tetratricopeptide (TPR) repeat protein